MFVEQAFRQMEHTANRIVLDLCAAPGGKSTHLLSLIDKSDLLVANEVIRYHENAQEICSRRCLLVRPWLRQRDRHHRLPGI